uniref:Sulfatase N-terminal domain-containing protein n=1 Tax=Panagrellus redivivus TaxID=6233 RepID=A0A7E4VUU7_PANRE
MQRIYLIIIALVVTILIFSVFDNVNSVGNAFNFIKPDYSHILPQLQPIVNQSSADQNKTGLLFDICILKELDPWEHEIDKLLNHTYDPFDSCNQTVEVATKLENGKLYLLDRRDNVQCWWQCLFPKDDYHLTQGGWNKLANGSVPECDVIETTCGKKHNNVTIDVTPNDSRYNATMFYEFVHAQTYRRDFDHSSVKNVSEMPQPVRPDVHIILIDSVSHSQFVRAMPKTRHYLLEHFEAVQFPHLNKVGINSRPNGFALLMGKIVHNSKKSPVSRGYSSECHNICCYPLDNGEFIGHQYREANYTTLMSEDYIDPIFAAGKCRGFNYTPVDHYMRPYQLRVDHQNYTSYKLRQDIYNGMCRDSYVPQIEYLQDLLDKFPDKPKFTITWMTHLAHNDNNMLFHTDEHFYNFFKRNSKKLANSYLFIMADHGIRYGITRFTAAGEREDNNPFFIMSLPASLRGNDEFRNVVRNNSRQLISQYDVYATLVDIVTPFRPQNSSQRVLHGASLFKPLPQPRSCDRLKIPFEYCTCDYPTTKLPDDIAPGREAGDALVKAMNDVISTTMDLKDICETLTLSQAPVSVESFETPGDLAIFKVIYKVSPGEGHFVGHVSHNSATGEITVLSSRLPRLDAYAVTAHCAPRSEFAAYCYCREQLQNTSKFSL